MSSKTQTTVKSALLAVAAVLLVTAGSPAAAEKKAKREPIEQFRATAMSLDRGRAGNFTITIYEWTSPEERQALLQTLVDGGSQALYDALDDVSEKGYLKPPRTLGYDMQYAWQSEVEGRRRIVLATDRPLGFVEVTRNYRSTDYDISLVVLDLDPETGKGGGVATIGAELKFNKKTGRLEIEVPGTQPTRLTNVKPIGKK